jgi:hypothetical protein
LGFAVGKMIAGGKMLEVCTGCGRPARGGLRFRYQSGQVVKGYLDVPLCGTCRRVFLSFHPIGSRVPRRSAARRGA